jgi:uncharacterized damage-inducible protein DinB
MTRTEKLAQRIQSEGQKTLAFFGEIDGDDWQKQLYADGNRWSVREVLVHIMIAERDLLRLFQNIVDGGAGVAENYDLDQQNNERVENEPVEKSIESLLEQFETYRAETVAWVSSLDDEALSIEGRHPFLGFTKVEEMLKLLYRHVQIHQRDIRKMLKGL